MHEEQHTWQRSPRRVTLRADEVHVWRAHVNRSASELRRLFSMLAADEVKRARAYHFERDRMRFVVARGLLRTLLGRYLARLPRRLQFSYSPYGRPFLEQEAGQHPLQFNLSHAGNCVLYAITRGRRVGIDVERRRPLADADTVARQFFSRHEYARLLRLPPHDRPEAFLHCWTCKEAYIKAIGEGLSYPLDRFDVSVDPSREAALLHVADAPEQTAHWMLRKLRPDTDHLGAVAVEGRDCRLTYWDIG